MNFDIIPEFGFTSNSNPKVSSRHKKNPKASSWGNGCPSLITIRAILAISMWDLNTDQTVLNKEK